MRPSYFFRDMGMDEAAAIVEAYAEERQERWEQTRRVVHAVFQIMSASRLEMQDVMRFSWEDWEDAEQPDKETWADMAKGTKEMMERAKKLLHGGRRDNNQANS